MLLVLLGFSSVLFASDNLDPSPPRKQTIAAEAEVAGVNLPKRKPRREEVELRTQLQTVTAESTTALGTCQKWQKKAEELRKEAETYRANFSKAVTTAEALYLNMAANIQEAVDNEEYDEDMERLAREELARVKKALDDYKKALGDI